MDTMNLNSIPQEVYNQINILKDAPGKFVNFVIELEAITDTKLKAKKAKSYLDRNNGINSISYPELQEALKDPDSKPMSFWRQMYLLERSIPRRDNSDTKSWADRLMVFADTYSLEHAADHRQLAGLPSKLLFSRHSGDHENLVAGPGKYTADFYCWDPENNRLFAYVEMKYSRLTDIEAVKNYYADPKKRYNARFLLVFLADRTFKLIDYTMNMIIDQPDLKAPENLLTV